MKFREFLDSQIKKGNTSWESRSEIIRASGSSQSGNTARILKEYENKFQFGSITEIKNNNVVNTLLNIPNFGTYILYWVPLWSLHYLGIVL